MKRILAVLLILTMTVVLFTACGEKETVENTEIVSDFEYIKNNGKMLVGVTEYEPMDYLDENGEWTGFDAEFAKIVGELMGVDIEFVVIDWDNKFLELESKAIDCIWNGMTITDEVRMNTACSNAYAKNEQVVVVNRSKGGDFSSLESIRGLDFAVESGSAAEIAADDLGLKHTAVKSQADALMEVQAGSVDGCIIDYTMAVSMTGKNTSYEDLAPVLSLTKEEYGIGFRRGSDMQGKMNEYIRTLKSNGKLSELSKKYGVALAN